MNIIHSTGLTFHENSGLYQLQTTHLQAAPYVVTFLRKDQKWSFENVWETFETQEEAEETAEILALYGDGFRSTDCTDGTAAVLAYVGPSTSIREPVYNLPDVGVNSYDYKLVNAVKIGSAR